MPKYPSSFINGAAPGVRSVDNVDLNRLVDNPIRSTETLGHIYPTDTTKGTPNPTNLSDTIGDLNTAREMLGDDLTAFDTALTALAALSADPEAKDRAYIAANISDELHAATREMLHLARRVARINEVVENVTADGTPTVGMYPSDLNRGF